MRESEKDGMRELFSAMRDERPSSGFTERVMSKVRREACRRERRRRRLAIGGYVSGGVAMAAVCAGVLYRMDVSFPVPFPGFEGLCRGSLFPFSVFSSPSFPFCFYIGSSALFLLIMDSMIRRYIERKHK